MKSSFPLRGRRVHLHTSYNLFNFSFPCSAKKMPSKLLQNVAKELTKVSFLTTLSPRKVNLLKSLIEDEHRGRSSGILCSLCLGNARTEFQV